VRSTGAISTTGTTHDGNDSLADGALLPTTMPSRFGSKYSLVLSDMKMCVVLLSVFGVCQGARELWLVVVVVVVVPW
jgi:hypothetical protein